MKPIRALSRLSLRIYLVSLLQLVVAALAIVFVHRMFEQRRMQHEAAQAPDLVLGFGEMFDQPDKLRRALAYVSAAGVVQLAYYTPDGAQVAATDDGPPPLDGSQLTQLRAAHVIQIGEAGRGTTTAVALLHDAELIGYGRLRMPRGPAGRKHDDPAAPGGHPNGPPRPPPFFSPIQEPSGTAIALVASAIIALLFARSLARPLTRLAHAAEAFGSGDLSVRSNIRRTDEIGSVARTFDEMADRVNALLRTQREFLANVSHELRTPLARIRVALDIAAEGDVDAGRSSLSDITEDWADLDRLVDSLITIARMDLARDPAVPAAALRKEPLDAVQLSERAAAAVRATHPRHAIVVEHADAALPLVADGAMLRRVLDNVLTNAAKYADPSAPIRLAVRREADAVEFTVTDRGTGIDATDLEHVFEPFFRADRSRTRATGGTGLGLALVKRIIDAHGGRIYVDSTVGVGTTVTFTVPVAGADGGD